MKLKITKTILFEIIMSLGILAILINMASIVIKNSGGEGDKKSGLTYNEVYALPKRPTQLQKDLYIELSEQLKADTDDVLPKVNLVVKSFVADYYTWTNKGGSYDVGGLTYIVSHSYLTLMESSRLGFYRDLDAFANKYGKDQLLEVETITGTSDYARPFNFLGEDYNAYYMEVEWTYVDREEFPEHEFQTKAAFIVIDFNGVLQIAQFLEI